MTQTSGRFFDEIARLMNDASGVAQGVRREFETLFKTQAERWLREDGQKPAWRPDWSGAELRAMVSVSKAESDPAPMLNVVVRRP